MMNHDVLIMPYDLGRKGVRAATAPNKLFQYIACGKPIVISDMPAFLKLPDGFVYRASDAAQFVNAVHQAFAEDSDEMTRARLKFAAENTWDTRGDRLRDLLDSAQTTPEVN
jgi:glycosyltransferase involved in cell wall biosynthesis